MHVSFHVQLYHHLTLTKYKFRVKVGFLLLVERIGLFGALKSPAFTNALVSCSLPWDCNGSSDGYAGHTLPQAGFVTQFGKVKQSPPKIAFGIP